MLRNNGVRATMFNVGQNVQNNRSAAQAQVAAGMWVANHSWNHAHMTSMSQAQMQSDLSQTNQAIQQATGSSPRLFRPPYGETNGTLQSVASSLGMIQVLWDVDSQDWNGASVSQIVSNAGRLQAGQVILMHDGLQNTRDAIPQIMSNLRSRNLCPGMISTSTGRAVAPDGGNPNPVPTTPGPTTPNPGGSCTATATTTNVWGDRYNTSVTVSGANALDRGGGDHLTAAGLDHVERQSDLGRQRHRDDDAVQRQRQHVRLHHDVQRQQRRPSADQVLYRELALPA